MVNTNCLEGWRCPKCNYTKRFLVQATCLVALEDDGTDETTDFDWEQSAFCECTSCGLTGTVAEFRKAPEPEEPVDGCFLLTILSGVEADVTYHNNDAARVAAARAHGAASPQDSFFRLDVDFDTREVNVEVFTNHELGT